MKVSSDIQLFLDKESTKSFLKTVEKFIELIEAKNIPINEFYIEAHELLIELYANGHKLEQVDLKYADADTDFSKLDDEYFRNINQELIRTLGKDCFYHEVFDPTSTKNKTVQSVQGWLVDDFADIYRDLKIEIEKMKIGTNEALEDALWQMKWGFINHWGNHCINALRYLHYLRYDGKISI